MHIKKILFPRLVISSLAGIALILPLSRHAMAQSKWKGNVSRYIQSLQKNDGGYGWKDQPDSHLTPTFAVIGILQDLGQLPDKPRRAQLIKFVGTHHPQYGADAIPALLYKGKNHVTYLGDQWKKGSEAGSSGSEMRDLIYQQIRSILWLGGDAGAYEPLVRIWKSQAGNLANYEQHGYSVLYQDMMTPVCRHLLGMDLTDSSTTKAYLASRRRMNGSFNNAPSSDGGDGNMLNTYWGLYALHILGETGPLKEETIRWLQSCQLKGGGFTHQPRPEIGANDEVAYTWAAVKALQLLGAKPADEKACLRYLLSLCNSDGGFGNRPGLPSTPMSTYYAIDALKTLNAFSYLDHTKSLKHQERRKKNDFKGLHIYSAQFEAPGVGSPLEAVMLADSLHIQLWGCKNGPDGWTAKAQKIADEKGVAVTFFTCDEPYGKYVEVSGMGSFGHILDFMSPAGVELPIIGKNPSWQQYDKHYVQPLLRSGGALLLQISNNEPLARLLLDESIKNGGYAAISTIHFDQDFLFWCPYLYQYRYQLPFVALQDAHGMESWWWTDELLGYRTLFLAKEPTYQAMMEALKSNLVAAVRHDHLSKYKTRMLGGAPGVQAYLLSHQNDWKWWGLDSTELMRPWAAITVIRPEDSFEVARPEQGVNIRIRCWWEASRPVLKSPIVELRQLFIDNIPVKAAHMEKKDRRGRLADSYYLYPITKLSEGTHVIKAVLTNTRDHAERVMTKTFLFK